MRNNLASFGGKWSGVLGAHSIINLVLRLSGCVADAGDIVVV